MYLEMTVADMFLIFALVVVCIFWKRAKDEADEIYDDMGHMLHLLHEKRAVIYKTDEGYLVEQTK